jgi:RHS repeat-associated protein
MPIDIGTGNVLQDFEDVSVPGQLTLAWERHYRSALIQRPAGALGPGWASPHLATLIRHAGGFEFAGPTGAIELFADAEGRVERGGRVLRPAAFMEVLQQQELYVVQAWNVDTEEVLRYGFRRGSVGDVLRLASVENAAGQGLDLYWEDERLLGVRQRFEGRELRPAYNTAGRIEAISLVTAQGQAWPVCNYEYDRAGRLASVTDANGFSDRFEYDAGHRLTREVLKDGGVFNYRYDDKGRCVHRTGLARYDSKRLRFLDASHMVEVTDSTGATTRYRCMSNGQVVTEWLPAGGERQFEYDEHGRLVAQVDATGGTTRHEYDTAGNRSATIDAAGAATRFTFDDRHQALTKTEAMGQVWQRIYDERYRRVAAIDPLKDRWQFRYDEHGNLCETIDPLGGIERRQYSATQLETVSAAGRRMRFEFDAFGRVTSRRLPSGETTRVSYDRCGNVVQVTLPDGAEMSAAYDPAGNLVRLVDAQGHARVWRYGTCGRMLEQRDPLGHSLRYVWGSEPGRLEEITNEKGETYRLEFDEAGRIAAAELFDGSRREFRYDAEDYLVEQVNGAGQTVEIQRDAMHRIVGRMAADAAPSQFAFDPCGRMIAAQEADHAVQLERDPLGRICREVQGEHWVATQYDAVGNVVLTCSSLGHQVEVAVDPDGLTKSMLWGAGTTLRFEHDASAREVLRVLPGGAQLSQRYDGQGRLLEQRVSSAGQPAAGAALLVNRRFIYDANGLLVSRRDERWGELRCAYDPAQQLIQTLRDRGGLSERFEYDPAGNVVHVTTEGGRAAAQDFTLSYAAGNRLERKGGTLHEYDGQGRLIRRIEPVAGAAPRIWTYRWDGLGRLAAVTLPDGLTWNYRYDALGRRIAKSRCGDPSSARRFVWNQEVLLHDIDAAGAVSSWMFRPDTFEPLATVQGKRSYAVVTDHLGTPCELIDDGNRVAWAADRDAWGRIEAVEGTVAPGACPISFAGQWQDDESGLNYNWHRYYDPGVGRYISPDPLQFGGGANFYRYCANNPYAFIDPLGLVCWSTARKNYWKSEAKNNSGSYSAANLTRMRDGKAPKMTVTVIDNHTGVVRQMDVSMELHHAGIPQRVGGPNVHNASNLSPLTPWQHEAVDPYRHTGTTLVSIDKGVGSW